MRDKTTKLLEEAYQAILESGLVKASKQNKDPEVLERMFKLLQTEAKFYCNILAWPSRQDKTGGYIEPNNLQDLLMLIPNKIKEIEEQTDSESGQNLEWNRVFIVADKVMDPGHSNFAKTAQMTDITNTITFINNRDHVLTRAYDPYGVVKSKEIEIPKPVSIPSMLAQGESLLEALYK